MFRPLALRPIATFASLALAAITFVPVGCGSEVACSQACEDDDAVVDTCPADGDCYEIDACGATSTCLVGAGEEQCLAQPACQPGDVEVTVCDSGASCYEASGCGTTILCEEVGDQCGAVPICDPDDTQVDSCPSEVSCYEAELCGTTILCLDGGTPHGCPVEEPTDGDACDSESLGQVCDYYDGTGCFTTYQCTAEIIDWILIGGGCDQVG